VSVRSNIDDLRRSALSAEARGSLIEATDLFKEVLALNPDDKLARLRLSIVLGRRKEFGAQEIVIQPLLKPENDGDFNLLWTLGMHAVQRKNWTRARAQLQKALNLAPHNASLAHDLARVAVEMQDNETLAKALNCRHGFDKDLSGYRALLLDSRVQFLRFTLCSNNVLQLLFSGNYEKTEREIVSSCFTPTDRVIEIGAGIGAVTTRIAERVGTGNILAVEANNDLIPIAEDTAAANGFPVPVRHGVVVNMNGQGGQAQSASFNINSDFLASSLLETGSTVSLIQVPKLGFASLVEGHRANALCIDIEGGEIELLKSADLSMIDKIVVEIHPAVVGNAACSECIADLVSVGFEIDFQLTREHVMLFRRKARSKSS